MIRKFTKEEKRMGNILLGLYKVFSDISKMAGRFFSFSGTILLIA